MTSANAGPRPPLRARARSSTGMRDAEQGYPLRALLRVIAEQVNLVEDDIAQLYDNWFIETCEDWVVPYIGDLIGYGRCTTRDGRARRAAAPRTRATAILIPRREVANTIRYRRRKGTLALLERARERGVRLAGARGRVLPAARGAPRTSTICASIAAAPPSCATATRWTTSTARSTSMAHTVDVRRVNSRPLSAAAPTSRASACSSGGCDPTPVTRTPAYCYEEQAPNCFLFSVLGNDTPLFIKPSREPHRRRVARPRPCRCRSDAGDFEARETRRDGSSRACRFYYGDRKSLVIWTRLGSTAWFRSKQHRPGRSERLEYRPLRDQVAVDPELGRIVFPPGQLPQAGGVGVVSLRLQRRHGRRRVRRVRSASRPTRVIYRVGQQTVRSSPAPSIRRGSATRWRMRSDAPANAVIEIVDSGVYTEPIAHRACQERTVAAAPRRQRHAPGPPPARLADRPIRTASAIIRRGSRAGSRSTACIVTGRGMQVEGDVVRRRHPPLARWCPAGAWSAIASRSGRPSRASS